MQDKFHSEHGLILIIRHILKMILLNSDYSVNIPLQYTYIYTLKQILLQYTC